MLTIIIFKKKIEASNLFIDIYVNDLITFLLKKNINIYLISYYNDEYSEYTIKSVSQKFILVNIPSPINLDNTNEKFLSRYATSVVNLLTGIIQDKSKIVFHINDISEFFIVKQLKARFSYPIINVIHTVSDYSIIKQNKQLIELSDRVVVLTKNMKNLIKDQLLYNDNVRVIPYGIDTSKFKLNTQIEKGALKKKWGFKPEEKIILFIGSIDQHTGIYNYIEAFIKVSESIDDLRLVIIGEGEPFSCLKQFRSLYGKLTFIGYIDSELISAFCQIANIGLVPIIDYRFYTICEMIANKIPLILPQKDELVELFESKQCFFVTLQEVQENLININMNEIASVMTRIANDQGMTNANDALPFLELNYSISQMGLAMLKLYNETSNVFS